MRQEGIDCLDHDDLSICSQMQSAFFQSGPFSHTILLGESEAILPLCLLLNVQQPFLNQEENAPSVLMTIDRTAR